MDVLAQRGELRMGADHVLAHVLGMRARVADPVDPVDGVDQPEQLANVVRCSPGRSRPYELTF